MRLILAIPARLTSKRAPGKHLREIHGEPLLGWLLQRVADISVASNVTVERTICTTEEPADKPLEALAMKAGVSIYRGSSRNIPLRLMEAANMVEADAIVCVDGDDIACAREAVSGCIERLVAGSRHVASCGLPFGMNAAGFSTRYLQDSVESKRNMQVLETGWGRVFSTPAESFTISAPSYSGSYRFTADYEQDIEFFSQLIGLLGSKFPRATTNEILDVVRVHNLHTLNEGLQEKYWQNFNTELKNESNS